MESDQVYIILTFLLLRNKTGKQYTLIQVIQVFVYPMHNTEILFLIFSYPVRLKWYCSVCRFVCLAFCLFAKRLNNVAEKHCMFTHIFKCNWIFLCIFRYGMFVHLNRDRIINFERALRDLGIRDDLYLLYKKPLWKDKGSCSNFNAQI